MLVKCSFCGKQKIVNNELYSSPIFHCDACDKLFCDEKIKEPALNPPPKNEKEKISFFIYLGIPIGLGFTIFGLSNVISYGTEYLFLLIFGLLMTAGDCFWIWLAHHEQNKRSEYYQKVLSESHKRLSKLEYQQKLIVACNGNTEIVSLLKNYNSTRGLEYILDVNDILHNYKFEKNTQKTIEEKISIPKNNIEDTIINENIENQKNKLFCRKCGTELLLDSDFCHRCGEKVKIK